MPHDDRSDQLWTPTTDGEKTAFTLGFTAGHDAAQPAPVNPQPLQAAAWAQGYDTGHTDAATETRKDIAATITDLAVQYAEINNALAAAGRVTRQQRIDADTTRMAADADSLHANIGTTGWVGLDNGGVLPSADWTLDPEALAATAERARRALALAPDPVLNTWADVRAYVDDRTWNRILGDLQPGPKGSRDIAIRQTNPTARGEAA